MIVVMITAVLAAIAIPTFTGYIYKSRTSEAITFLGTIKLREESYRSEFGQYASAGLTAWQSDFGTALVPRAPSALDGDAVAFPTTNASWNQLGARPDGAVRFSYGIAAGDPTTNPPPTAASPTGLGYAVDHWFVAQAQANLDNDGTLCTFELGSQGRQIWFNPEKGWE
jgi:type II secretory pathway pseudopilin PulG